jgi:hypothetical protein
VDTTVQSTERNQEGQQAPEWLLADLEYILDYCVQEGQYEQADQVAAILEEAVSVSSETECSPAAT